MYQVKFSATDDASWGAAIELFDDDTGQALEQATDATFELQVVDCGSAVLSATTDDDTITKPEDNIVQWVFSRDQMGSLCPGKTYAVGLTMTIEAGTTQIFIGSLAVLDGNVS